MLAPLLVSSSYSLGFGTASPRALARRARELGWGALGLSDRGGLYGLPDFMEAAAAEGLKPLVAAELARGPPGRAAYASRVLAIVLERRGLSRLCRLLTARGEPGFELRAELLRDSGGLALASDDPEFLAAAPEAYALLSPCARAAWRRLLATGRRPLATGEARLLDAGDRALQRLLLAISSLRTVGDVAEAELSPRAAVLSGPEAFAQAYEAVPEALAQAESLIASVAFDSLFDGFVFPRYGEGSTTPEAATTPQAATTAATILRRLVYEGAERRYRGGSAPPERVRERVEYELGIIEAKGFCDYFLVVRDIVRRASRSCGRGSAAASVVAYALGITDVDPIRYGLYFDRFLNPGRVDPPDIDVDFAWDERDALLAAVLQEYGEERSARVCNHVRFQARSALREAARAYGLPEGEIVALERRSVRQGAEAGVSADDPAWEELRALAPRLVGLPRNLGVHSGGVVLAPGRIDELVPVERSGSGIRVSAWDKDGVEAAGLVKIDLLGNRSLAVVRDALANAADNGAGLDEAAWRPADDPQTVGLLARGDTMGVFYVESPAMRLLQRKTGRGDFERLVVHSSIIRPAANRYIDEYIDRLKGKPYEPLHPLVGDILAESLGIMCYQEDVCKVAVAVAGFSPSEADAVRKALAKRDATERLPAFEARFREGARARGVADSVIQELWDMIASFAGYSFVKAHSASYAMLSFRSAYLRRHRPAEFMAAVLSNRGGYYSTLAYASEARRMGLSLLAPDVNASALRCLGRDRELRFGLGMIGSLGSSCAEAIVAERKARGAFRSIPDLALRVRIDRGDAEALVGSGALDSLSPELSRESKLMSLLSAQAEREAAGLQSWLFDDPSDPSGRGRSARGAMAPARRSVAAEERRRLEYQMRYLGTTLAIHPLALWPGALAARRTRGVELPGLVGRRVRLLAWPIAGKQVVTAGGREMEFVSFEDESALYETVFFPEAYERLRPLLLGDGPLFIRGLVEENRGAVTLTVEGAERAG